MLTLRSLKQKGVREFRAEATGEYTTSRNGRRIPVTRGVEYINTEENGRMPVEKWYEAMEEAVKAEGKTPLLEKIIEHCRRLAWLRTEEDIRHHALECLDCEAYKAWGIEE